MDINGLKITISFRLAAPMYVQLSELADREDTTVSDMTRQMVSRGILATVGQETEAGRERVTA